MQLTPSLHRIGNDIVAAYLIVTAEGITVVDAGLPGFHRDLRRELAGIGRTLDDIRGVVLTHGDSDHVGFAERLRREHGVPVYVHAADAARARGGEKPKTPLGPVRLGPLLQFAAYGARKGIRPQWLTAVEEVSGGDVLPLPGEPRVIDMPGHSPGSVAVYSPAAAAIFVGDALTTRHVLTGRSGPGPAPFTDDPAEAIASLDRIAALPAAWVLPGHGPAFHGSPAEAVAAVRAASS
ncbi:glyoxylase-like metal-dependent hydrolase (beta-lactamase superfamily II) [Microbacterium paludicola]|uniref:Glyoxylase-like metal-dependent hydrolase (Beta-lactamase superfamily II) n=1 Tax=Microbacterium paludicola TaxID=300019 RepID=A0ABU1HYK4_9MICO|nr:MBL fold metallo-hydrolase [Microbacterium paludicola]MDR6166706.1 glyoxylase-like metal-dependent hydrolase (beta-lactamase superfamily II) [Microbacterium paludicola]